jgi:hypothetical protein
VIDYSLLLQIKINIFFSRINHLIMENFKN